MLKVPTKTNLLLLIYIGTPKILLKSYPKVANKKNNDNKHHYETNTFFATLKF